MVEPRRLEVAADWRTLQSPETYLGYGQASGFAQEGVARFDEPHDYDRAGPAGPQPLGARRGRGRSRATPRSRPRPAAGSRSSSTPATSTS